MSKRDAEGWAQLAAQVAHAEAVRAVKRLQHAWGHYAEAGDFDAMAALFCAGGSLVLPPEEASGPASIRDLIARQMGREGGLTVEDLNTRLFLSPVVTLSPDGRSARARWHEVAMTAAFGEGANWSGGIHENEYVNEGGIWKIATLRYYPQFAGSYESGWHNLRAETPLVPFHFSVESAGRPWPVDPEPLAGPHAEPGQLAARVCALLDESAVHNLYAAYGHYMDRKMWDEVAELFTAGGRLEVAGEGIYDGRDSIRRGLERHGPAGLKTGELHDHVQLMPYVSLASDRCTARLRGIELRMLAVHGQYSAWGLAVVDATFVREAGRWMLQTFRVSPRMLADGEQGWAHARFELPPAAAYATPDRADRQATRYPDHRGPAVTFTHPVRERSDAPLPLAEADLPSVRADLAVAMAYDGVENVACAYGYFLDEAHWDETADLFSVDGWKELSYVGTYIGRERIRESLVARYGRKPRRPNFLAIHQKTEPYVTVAPDGQRAQMRLKMFQINSAHGAEGGTIIGLYEEQAVLEHGVWKIHGMDLDYVVLAGYRQGWSQVDPDTARRFAPSAEDLQRFDPDGPLRGLAFAPYPEIGPIGFHFMHPLSGRRPPILFEWSDGRFVEA